MNENQLSKVVLDCAFKIHKKLGPGLLESAYSQILSHELRLQGLRGEKEKSLPIIYEGIKLEQGYRIDLLINDKLVIEIKAVEKLHEVHQAQVLTYLKLGGYKLGLLINFHSKLLKYGIKRYIMS